MLLTPEKSLCEKNQAIIVSKDKGASREHRANNPERKFDEQKFDEQQKRLELNYQI